jgi:PKHD-type hydroxylase
MIYSSAYNVIWQDDIFNLAEIQSIKELSLNYKSLHSEIGLVNNNSNISVIKEQRNSNVIWIPYQQETAWVYNKISLIVQQINTDHYYFQLSGSECLQYSEYNSVDAGHYDWHADTLFLKKNGTEYVRKISVSIPISSPSEYTGGAFLIKPSGQSKEVEQKQGRLIVFPSWMPHCVKPVLSGNRTSLVLWFYGNKFQ